MVMLLVVMNPKRRASLAATVLAALLHQNMTKSALSGT